MRTAIIFLVAVVSACSSTKISPYSSTPRIVKGEQILMMNIHRLSSSNQYQLYELARETLQGSNEIYFAPQLEYDLIKSGISKEEIYDVNISDSLMTAIAKITQSRYLLFVEYLGSRQGDQIGSYTALELKYDKNASFGNETNSASLLFRVVDIEPYITERKFHVKTNIGPLEIQENDGGVTRVNISNELMAITTAFEKGMKNLKKGVIRK